MENDFVCVDDALQLFGFLFEVDNNLSILLLLLVN